MTDFTNMFKNASPIGGAYSKSAVDEKAVFMEDCAKCRALNEASAKEHGTHTRTARFETSSGYVHGLVKWEEDFATFKGEEISMGMTPRFIPNEAGEIIINQMYDTFPWQPWSVSRDLKWVNIPLEDGHYGSPEYKLDYALIDAHARIRELEAERDKLLATAKQVVNLIEGLDGYGLARSVLDETRLKDEPRWVFFYNEVAAQSRAALAETEGRGDG